MKINVFLKYIGSNSNLHQYYDTRDVFSKYKTYHPDASDLKAIKYYYFILNNIVYLKII